MLYCMKKPGHKIIRTIGSQFKKYACECLRYFLKMKTIPSVNSQLSQNVGDKYVVFIFLRDLYFYNKHPLILRGKA